MTPFEPVIVTGELPDWEPTLDDEDTLHELHALIKSNYPSTILRDIQREQETMERFRQAAARTRAAKALIEARTRAAKALIERGS